MPFADNPFSAIQSSPFHQAIGPLTQTMQGPGGSVGQSPFAYMPPPAPPGSVYSGMMPPPAAGLRQNAWQMYGMQSMNPFRPGFYQPSAVSNPAAMIGAAYNIPTQVAGYGAGLIHTGVGATAMALGAPLAMSAAKNLWAAKGSLGGIAASTIGNIWASGGTLSAVGNLGVGAGRMLLGLGGAIGPQAIAMAALYAGYKATQFALGGVSDVRDVHRAIGDTMGGFMGLPGSGFSGRGLGYGASAGIAQLIQASGGQAFRNFSQSFNVFQQLASSGELVRGMRSAQDMKRTLDDAFKTVGELLEVLNTTFEQAGKAFGKIRSMGLGNKRSMVQMALNARVQGGMIGMSADQMLELGSEGASAARGMGMYGAGGAFALMGAAAGFGTAFQSGAIDARLMSEITGGTMDPTAAAGAFGRSALAFQRGSGQYLVAGLMGRGGNIDRAALQDLLSGKTSVKDIISRGTSFLAQPGALNKFLANKQRLTSDLFEKAGDDILSLYYQMARYSAEMTPGGATDEMMQLFLQNNMNLDESMALAVIRGGSPDQAFFRRQRKSAARAQAEREARRRRGSIGGILETELYSPVRKFGASLSGFVSGVTGSIGSSIDDFYSDFYGEQRAGMRGEWLTSSVRDDMLFGDRVGYSRGVVGSERSLAVAALDRAVHAYSKGNFFGQLFGNRTNLENWSTHSIIAGENAANMGAGGAVFGWMLSSVAEKLANRRGDPFAHVDIALDTLRKERGVGDINEFMINNLTKTGSGAKVLDQIAKDLGIVVRATDTSAKALLRAAASSEETSLSISRSLASSGLDVAGKLGGGGMSMRGVTGVLMSMAAGSGGTRTLGEQYLADLRSDLADQINIDAIMNGQTNFLSLVKEWFNADPAKIDALMNSGSNTSFGLLVRQGRAERLGVVDVVRNMMERIKAGDKELHEQLEPVVGNPTKVLQEVIDGGGSPAANLLRSIIGRKLSMVSASPREMARATEGIRQVLQGILASQGKTVKEFFGEKSADTVFGKSLASHVPILDPTSTYVDATKMYGEAIDKLMADGVKESEVGALAALGVTPQGIARAREKFGQITAAAAKIKDAKKREEFLSEQAALIRGRLGIDKDKQNELVSYLSGKGVLSPALDKMMIKKMAQAGELGEGITAIDEGQAMFRQSVQTFQDAVMMFAESVGAKTETTILPSKIGPNAGTDLGTDSVPEFLNPENAGTKEFQNPFFPGPIR